MVDLMGSYLNRSDLADSLLSAVRQLRHEQGQDGGSADSVRSASRSDRRWRVVDRLDKDDIETLVAAFTAGTPKRKLVERYGISESSVKRLIRWHGASKPSTGLPIAHSGASHRKRFGRFQFARSGKRPTLSR